MHLVSRTYADQRGLMEGAMGMARLIAAKSPLAVAGTKRVLLQQRWGAKVQGEGGWGGRQG